MKYALLGGSLSWIGTSLAYYFSGGFNLGNVAVGLMLLLCWALYFAFRGERA